MILNLILICDNHNKENPRSQTDHFYFEDIKIYLNEPKCIAKLNKYYNYIVIFGKRVEMLYLNFSEFNLFMT